MQREARHLFMICVQLRSQRCCKTRLAVCPMPLQIVPWVDAPLTPFIVEPCLGPGFLNTCPVRQIDPLADFTFGPGQSRTAG